jgi:predicted ATPase
VRELPSGTVTFLFTDIEGSTRLLHELGDEYAGALAEHRRALREAFAEHGGVEVDTQGDAFFVAFARAQDALAAAGDAQAALSEGLIRVRMGLHTGEPLVTDEGYVGLDVHRAARIAAVGHGGQILVSQSTRDLVDADGLRDLGEHRLKDFTEPVSIFQVGDDEFPPLKTISNTNLPRPASSFVGREREVDEIRARLQDSARLLTLTGPGGSGKTRLAIEAAGELVPEFKAGVFWVGLASVRDPGVVSGTIAQMLGAKNGLLEHIGDRELLLLLDNLEQVVDAAPELAALVESCPNLRLLVTSRELLRVRGEVEYPVQPLAEPEAVELFCARAQTEPDEAVDELCRALDNLPLALELAAARASVLSPNQILERLSRRLDLLKGGRDADPRQQTLRAAIAWSHELLDAEEQRLFSRLAVFRGGCTLEAAQEVAGADLDTLQSLVDKSLVRHTEERFWMLETIREYAAERLDDAGEAEELRRRHADHVLALAEKARPELHGPGQKEWVWRIEAERDNVRAALGWALDGEDPALGLRLAAALGHFWWGRGPGEGLAWLERGLEQQANVAPEIRADALDAAGGTAWFLGDHEYALRLFEDGLAIFRQLGDHRAVARMLNRLAPPLLEAGRSEEAEHVVEEALEINRELNETRELVLSLHILAALAADRDVREAERLYEESIALSRSIGDSWQLAYNLFNCAEVVVLQGDPARAWSLGREALAVSREIGDDIAALCSLSALAVAAARSGDARLAGELWGSVDRLDEELGETLWRSSRSHVEELLGERGSDFEHGYQEGQRLSLERAAETVLES